MVDVYRDDHRWLRAFAQHISIADSLLDQYVGIPGRVTRRMSDEALDALIGEARMVWEGLWEQLDQARELVAAQRRDVSDYDRAKIARGDLYLDALHVGVDRIEWGVVRARRIAWRQAPPESALRALAALRGAMPEVVVQPERVPAIESVPAPEDDPSPPRGRPPWKLVFLVLSLCAVAAHQAIAHFQPGDVRLVGGSPAVPDARLPIEMKAIDDSPGADAFLEYLRTAHGDDLGRCLAHAEPDAQLMLELGLPHEEGGDFRIATLPTTGPIAECLEEAARHWWLPATGETHAIVLRRLSGAEIEALDEPEPPVPTAPLPRITIRPFMDSDADDVRFARAISTTHLDEIRRCRALGGPSRVDVFLDLRRHGGHAFHTKIDGALPSEWRCLYRAIASWSFPPSDPRQRGDAFEIEDAR